MVSILHLKFGSSNPIILESHSNLGVIFSISPTAITVLPLKNLIHLNSRKCHFSGNLWLHIMPFSFPFSLAG